MDMILMTTILLFLGLCFGSFAGATVWRLRARQLVEDKAGGEEVDKKELTKLLPLTQHRGAEDRSRCLSCGHQLAWFDLLPMVSWISTGGKCRYCKKKIGSFEPLIELGTAAFFVIFYLLWPQPLTSPPEITQFVLWLIGGVMLIILLTYDLKWFLLPNRVMFPLIVVAVIYSGIKLTQADDLQAALISLGGAVLILSGLYLFLWLISKGRWIGFGDIKLGLVLALFLADWKSAFLALFAANLVGCLIVIPGLISGKLSRQTQVPFGPMLIIGFVIAALFGQHIIDWYLSTSSFLML
ncbi:MAG: prepilin peptidase [Candidatus Saccharibacteria bacterium]